MEKISKEVFEEELGMCARHFQKKGCCAWGKCENCGVPLLLKKLHSGEIIDESEAIKNFKKNIFSA